MNNQLDNTESVFSRVKVIFNEQLWLVLLLAPLIVIAILVGQYVQPEKNQMQHVNVSSALAAVSPEVSTAQLAAIVAKPLSELLTMDVYFDKKVNVRSFNKIGSLESNENLTNEAYNELAATEIHYSHITQHLTNKAGG